MKTSKEISGFLNLYKPIGITSHDAVNAVRRVLSMKHIGHGGTLDPLAEGVLPIAVGSSCRLIRFLPQGKTYLASFLLGKRTNTDDITGDVIEERGVPSLTVTEIELQLRAFIGKISQVPPIFSAIHVGGKRLYEIARSGVVDIQIEPRLVTINSIEVLGLHEATVTVRIDCSGGTYIRSIARDLGEKLGCGACMSTLTRERSGRFLIDESVRIADFKENPEPGNLVVPPLRAFAFDDGFLELPVDAEITLRIRQGKPVMIDSLTAIPINAGKIILISHDADLVAVCRVDGPRLKTEVVVGNASS